MAGFGMGNQGILGAMAPQQQAPGWGGIFAALQDAGAHLGGGGRADNFANYQAQNEQRQQIDAQNQMRQQLLQGLTSGDPAAQKQAVLAYTAAGGDPSHIISAMSFGKPTIEHYGESENVWERDPLTGERTQVQTGKRPAPMGYAYEGDGLAPVKGGPADPNNPANLKPPSGYQWQPGALPGTRLQVIPGFVGGAAEIAAARRGPQKAAAVKPTIAIPHPGSMY